jgi:hypothetical protein
LEVATPTPVTVLPVMARPLITRVVSPDGAGTAAAGAQLIPLVDVHMMADEVLD